MRESCDVCERKSDNLDDGICNVCLTVARCHPDRNKRYSLSVRINNRTKHRVKALSDAQMWKAR